MPRSCINIYSISCFILIFAEFVIFGEGSRCRLPWTGVWLENGKELNITHNAIGNLGSCVHKSRDLYLLTSDTSRGACYRCVITFPVHENVLHYKSTQCIFENDMSLERCSQLMSADTTMHTLFRRDATMVPCPIEAPLNFTYQSNYGICSSRTSQLHRCAQYNRLALHYQACPEIPNREASVWQMECIGSWQSFGQSYFAARVGYKGGEQYRCFIMEKSGSSGRIGESADAGCQELTHIGAAATTLHFKQDSPISSLCDFPFSMNGDRSRHWESMLTGTSHRIIKGSWVSTIRGRNETVWSCLRQHTYDDQNFYIRAHVAVGCKTGYQCIKVHVREPHLLHVAYGEISSYDNFDDCSDFVVDQRDTLTLNGAQQACPIGGKHYSPICRELPTLSVGCSSKYSMQLVRDCSLPDGDDYSCVAHYKHEDNDFIVARDTLSRQLVCMTYISSRIKLLRVYDRVSCDAASVNGAVPMLTLNFTASDSCSPSLLTGFLYSTRSSSPSTLIVTSSFVVSLLLRALIF